MQLKRKKHKKKVNRIILFTSDAVNGKTRQIKIAPWLFHILVVLLCIIVGGVIGFGYYGGTFLQRFYDRQAEQVSMIDSLSIEKQTLETENASLNEKIAILSETVNQKVLAEQELHAKNEQEHIPSGFPLTGSASVRESLEEEPICIFSAEQGTIVITSATGTVVGVEDDEEYGHKITIDHGNGYCSIYLNQGDPLVKASDEVTIGATLFLIGEENTELGYQIQENGVFVNPMDMLAISG